MTEPASMGRATVLTCPQCAEPLYEVEQGGALPFRCASGHAYAPDALCPGIADDLQGLLLELVGALTD